MNILSARLEKLFLYATIKIVEIKLLFIYYKRLIIGGTLLEKIYIALIVIAVIVLISIVFSALKKINKNRIGRNIGRAGERKVAKIIRKFSRHRRCKVLNGAYLPLYNGSCEIDHIVFGKFGVAIIETKNTGGHIKGSGKYLDHYIGSKKFKLYNPKMQNKTHTDNLRHHLLKHGFKKFQLHPIIVFANEKTIIPDGLGIHASELYNTLEHLPKGSFDYIGAYKAIKSVRIKSPIKKFLHKYRR